VNIHRKNGENGPKNKKSVNATIVKKEKELEKAKEEEFLISLFLRIRIPYLTKTFVQAIFEPWLLTLDPNHPKGSFVTSVVSSFYTS